MCGGSSPTWEKSPIFFDPAGGPWRAGSALRASPARRMKGGGQKKGDFSQLGDEPPLPAVSIIEECIMYHVSCMVWFGLVEVTVLSVEKLGFVLVYMSLGIPPPPPPLNFVQ